MIKNNLFFKVINKTDLLVSDLTFQLESGVSVLVTGDSGCGKSSLLRVIGGIWPTVTGKAHQLQIRIFPVIFNSFNLTF